MSRLKVKPTWNRPSGNKIVHGPIVRKKIPKIKNNDLQATVRNAISKFKAINANKVDIARRFQGRRTKGGRG